MALLRLLIFIPFLLIACVDRAVYRPEFINDPITKVNISELISRANNLDNVNHDFLVLLKKTVYRLYQDNRVIIETHQVIKVLTDKKGAIGNSFIYFRDGYEHVPIVEAYTITKNNKRVEAKRVYTLSPFNNSYYNLKLYRDIRVKVVSFSSIEKGSILNLRYQVEVRYSDLASFINGIFYLASSDYILRQKLVIILPRGRDIWFRSIRTSIKPSRFTRGDMDYYVLVSDNIEVVESEPFKIAYKEVSPRVLFSTIKTWGKLNSSIYSLISSGIGFNEVVTSTALRLTKGIESLDKKAELLYNFVTNTKNIINIALPFRVRGYVPSRSSKVLGVGYGDSLDKSVLLLNLLRAVGIDASIVLTNESFDFDNRIPLLRGLDRVLVAIHRGDGYLFLDPYSALVPYGSLPGKVYGRSALILGNKPVITRIPLTSSSDNKIIYKTLSELTSNGKLRYTTNFITTGSYEVSNRLSIIAIMQRDSFSSLLDNYRLVYESLPDVKLLNVVASDPFDIVHPFKYSSSFIVNLSRVSGDLVIQPRLYNSNLSSFSSNGPYTIDFILPFTVLSDHRIRYSSRWRIKSLPRLVNISSLFWSYFREVKRRGNIILYKRRFEVKLSKIPMELYEEFREFMDMVIKMDKQVIKLVRRR